MALVKLSFLKSVPHALRGDASPDAPASSTPGRWSTTGSIPTQSAGTIVGWVIQSALADFSHEPGSELPGGRGRSPLIQGRFRNCHLNRI